jgi:uncharacterized protein (DUF2252 family)
LLEHYRLVDGTVKAVGTGSMGIWCFVVLLTSPLNKALFVQWKEAGPSVPEPYAGKSAALVDDRFPHGPPRRPGGGTAQLSQAVGAAQRVPVATEGFAARLWADLWATPARLTASI